MQPQLGQIVLCAFTFTQDTTRICDGSLLPISYRNEYFELFLRRRDHGGTRSLAQGPIPTPYDSPYQPAHGQLLRLGYYPALYSIIGKTYGGDGRNNFALPALAAPPTANGQSRAGYGFCCSGIYPLGTTGDSTIGTLQLFAFAWDLKNFLPCDGGAYSVSAYRALHSVIGTTFGGSASTFNVPNLAAPAGMRWTIVADGVMPSNVNET